MKYQNHSTLNALHAFSRWFLFFIVLSITLPGHGQWEEEQKIIPQVPGVDFYTNRDDNMGRSVSVDGDYALIGVPDADIGGSNTGMALLYRRDGGQWVEEQVLIPVDGEAEDQFGISVSISGNSAIIGAYRDDDNGTDSGSSYVFEKDSSGNWLQKAKLYSSDIAVGDRFGSSVSVSGNTILVATTRDEDNGVFSGSAYIFDKDGAGSWSEVAKLTPADGAAEDFFGISVCISGSTAIIGALSDTDNGTEAGAAYIFERDGTGNWTEETKLTASDGAGSDRLGWSVAVSGNTALVGAYQDDDNETNSGSAYVFQKNNLGSWSETAKLTASDGASLDNFGISVSLSGNTALVGASSDDDNGSSSGSAYVFQKNNVGSWLETTKLTASDGASFDNFGISVSLAGNTALIGASTDDDNGMRSGSAYVFEKDGSSNWNESVKLSPKDGGAEDSFGYSVSVSGNTALVGAYRDNDNGDDSGSAYIFEKDESGNWILKTNLTPEDGAIGDIFGYSVSLSDNTAIVGAYFDDDNGSASGSAYVFERNGAGNWIEVAKLTASDGGFLDQFGVSVSVSGNTAMVGAHLDDDNGGNSGSVYVFTKNGSGNWAETAKLFPSELASSDRFGYAVSISENTALIGAYRDDDNGSESGSAYVFERDATGNWSEAAKLIPSDGAADDRFGYSVSISGNTALVGSYLDDDNGSNSGSAYFFEKNSSGNWIEEAKLKPNDGAADDWFGVSVSVSGSTVFIGAPGDDDSPTGSGFASVFEKNSSGIWIEADKLVPSEGADGDQFGYSVSTSGNTAIVGAYEDDDNGMDSGSAYIFSGSGCASDIEAPDLIMPEQTSINIPCMAVDYALLIDYVNGDLSPTQNAVYESFLTGIFLQNGLVPLEAIDECNDAFFFETGIEIITAVDCPNKALIRCNFIAEDALGNLSEPEFTELVVVDNSNPHIFCPADIVITCESDFSPEETGFATATDNCVGDVAITFQDLNNPVFCPTSIIRLWTATDECGNVATCEQLITLVEEEDCAIAPSNLQAEAIGAKSIRFTWNPVPNSVACRVFARVAGSNMNAAVGTIIEPEPSELNYTFNGLNNGLNIEWRVLCACDMSPLALSPYSPWIFYDFFYDDNKNAKPSDDGLINEVLSGQLYPNPSRSSVFLESEFNEGESIKVMDLSGKVIAEYIVTAGLEIFEMNIEKLESGVYFVQQAGLNGRSQTFKVVKN